MGQTSFLDTSFIRYLVPSLGFKRYFPIPNDQNIMQWMAKTKALSKETKILAINGINMYIFKTFVKYKRVQWLHLPPTKWV